MWSSSCRNIKPLYIQRSAVISVRHDMSEQLRAAQPLFYPATRASLYHMTSSGPLARPQCDDAHQSEKEAEHGGPRPPGPGPPGPGRLVTAKHRQQQSDLQLLVDVLCLFVVAVCLWRPLASLCSCCVSLLVTSISKAQGPDSVSFTDWPVL